MRINYLIIFLLLVPIAFASTELTLDLASSELSADQPFQGTLKISTSETILNTEPVNFYINSNKESQLIGNLSLSGNINYIEESFNKMGSATSLIIHTFTKADKQTISALDLSQKDVYDLTKISKVTNLSFKIQGEINNGKYPMDVQLDIGSDGTSDYSYKGELIGSFEDLPHLYLKDNIPDAAYSIKGGLKDVFCEQITIKPSKNFKIITKVEPKPTTTKIILRATLSNSPLSSDTVDCESSPDICCTFITSGISKQDVSCEVKIDVKEEKDMYACVFVAGGLITDAHFSLQADLDDAINQGYYNGIKKAKEDFYITVAKQNFNRELKTTELVILDGSIIQSYINNKKTLLVPISVSSSNSGIVKLKELNLAYELGDGLETTQQSFTPIKYTQQSLKFVEPVTIPLSVFNEILTPSTEGKDYSLYVEFLGTQSDIVKFNVIPGPTAVIQRSSEILYLGQEVMLSGQASKTHNNNTITDFVWTLGDGANLTGESVMHAYSIPGNYTVTLTIKDSQGTTASSSIYLQVVPLEQSLSFLVNETKLTAEQTKKDIDAASEQIKQALTLLNIPNKMNAALANLTIISNELNAILNNTQINEAQKNSTLKIISSKLIEVRKGVVSSFEVSIAEFDAKAYSLSDIPTASQLQREEIDSFQEKVFIAQQSSTIKGDLYVISLDYLANGTIDQILIKKEITGGGEYYEIIPQGVIKKEIIQPVDSQMISPNIIKFSSSPILYTVETQNLELLLQAKTIIIPADLASISTGKLQIVESSCGDDVCDPLIENEDTCPADCSPSRPWLIIILIILIIGGVGAYYIFGYKGKYSLDKISIKKKVVMPPRTIFKSEKDKVAIKDFIRKSFAKGFNEEQISLLLKKKNWTIEQIRLAFNEVKSEK